jgi:DNA-binding NtrC family response regulator
MQPSESSKPLLKPRIMIVEDEPALAQALATAVRRLDAEPVICPSGYRARSELAVRRYGIVILDIGLPDLNGLSLLTECNGAKVLVITAHGNLANAVAAKKQGAAAYLVKPIDLDQLQTLLREWITALPPQGDDAVGVTPAKPAPLPLPAVPTLPKAAAKANAKVKPYAVHKQKPMPYAGAAAATSSSPGTGGDQAAAPAPTDRNDAALLVGAAPAMQRVFVEIAHASVTDAPLLVTGPTGTGKTLVARVVHANSDRRSGPFVTLQCSAFPEQLLESELFGHERNAFTGATAMRTGHIERAAGGTLLLDEIADIAPSVQAKLLRFVEEKTFVRLGGREDHRVDLRLMAATNKDLKAEVKAGRFREDLYFRLRVLEIKMPSLAERAEDIGALSSLFLGRLAPDRSVEVSGEALRLMQQYAWPGNVRELRNALEHAVAVSNGMMILPQHLPSEIRENNAPLADPENRFDDVLAAWVRDQVASGVMYDDIEARLQERVLRELMRLYNHKSTHMARALKMNRVTLLKRRKMFNLDD